MKALIQPIQPELDETTVCNAETETEPNPGMMQSIKEHQEIQGRGCSDAGRRTEEAAFVPASGCGAPPEEEGKDLGILWIQE
jgi:hypothetical protein